MASSMDEVFDVLIIGCGAVGAAVAREMTLIGQKCIVLEKNMDVLSEASSGNTGHLVSISSFLSCTKHCWNEINDFSKFSKNSI